MGFLNEVWLRARHTHIQFVQDVIIREELSVVGVVLGAQVQEGQDAGGPHVRDGEARLRLGGEGRALLARVLTQFREARLELQKPACQEVDTGEGAAQLVQEDVQEGVLWDGGERVGILVVHDDVQFVVEVRHLTRLLQVVVHRDRILLEPFLAYLGGPHVDGVEDVRRVELAEGAAVDDQRLVAPDQHGELVWRDNFDGLHGSAAVCSCWRCSYSFYSVPASSAAPALTLVAVRHHHGEGAGPDVQSTQRLQEHNTITTLYRPSYVPGRHSRREGGRLCRLR